MRLKILCFLFIIVFNSCMGWGDLFSYSKKIPGNYKIFEDEGTGYKSLYYQIDNGGIIRIENVIKIGWNDSIIVAESPTGYYILDKTKDSMYKEAQDVVYGPINYEIFIKALNKAHINKLDFKIVYK